MKKTFTRTLAALLMLLMVVGMLPMAAFATVGDDTGVWVGGVRMKVGYYLPSGNSPTEADLTDTEPTSGGYAYMKDATTLVLKDYSFSGLGHEETVGYSKYYQVIYSELSQPLTIELLGENSLASTATGTNNFGYGITANNKPLTIKGDGSLDISGAFAGIIAKDDLTIKDTTVTVTITSDTGNTGLWSEGDLTITNSTVYVSGGAHGYNGKTGFTVTNSTVTAVGSSAAVVTDKPSLNGYSDGVLVKAGASAEDAAEIPDLTSDWHKEKYLKIMHKPVLAAVWIGNVEMKVGYYLPSGNSPTEADLTDIKPTSGGYAYMKNANTLVLKNYSYKSDGNDAASIYSGLSSALTIELQGTNTLENTAGHGIDALADLTINGGGTLIVSGDTEAIYALVGVLTIDNCTIIATATASTSMAIQGYSNVNITNSTVTASSKTMGILAFSDLTITGSIIDAKGAHAGCQSLTADVIITDSTVTVAGGTNKPDLSGFTTAYEVKAGDDAASAAKVTDLTTDYHREKYIKITPKANVWVGGVQMEVGKYLPSGNSPTDADLTTTQPTSGGYAYMQDATTLVLKDYSYEGVGYVVIDNEIVEGEEYCSVIRSKVTAPFTIELQGESSLVNTAAGKGKFGYGINANSNLNITGGGSVSVSGGFNGIVSSNDITITNSTLTVSGGRFHGILTHCNLTITNSTVTASGTDGSYGIVANNDFTITDSVVTASAGGTGVAIYSKPDLSGFTTAYEVKAGDNAASAARVTDLTTDYHKEKYVKITPKANVWVGGVNMEVGKYLPSGNSPTDADLTETQPTSGGYAYMKDATTLVLKDYSYEGEGYEELDGEYYCHYAILSELTKPLTIELQGTSTLENTAEGDNNYGIYVDNDLEISGGTLNITCDDDAIYCEGDLTIEDCTVTATVDVDDGFQCDGLTITDSTVTVTVGDEGLSCTDDITIENSTVTVTAGDDALDCANVVISESTVNVTADDYGINCDDITISNSSTVNATGVADDGIRCVNSSITDSIVTAISEAEAGIDCDSITIKDSIVTASTTGSGMAIDEKPTLNYTDGAAVKAGGNAASAAKVTDLSTAYNEEKYVKIAPSSAEHTVTVNSSTASATGAGDYIVGDTVTINAGTKSGYTFSGWTTSDGVTFANKNSAGTTFVMPNNDVTVTANWTKKPAGDTTKTFFLTFETNGGSNMSPESFDEGTEVQLSGYAPRRDGYTFAGWCSDSALTQPVTSVKMTGNITVYALWSDGSQPEKPIAGSAKMTRLAGNDRIATAIEISKAGYDKADTVVLASGYSYPDALAGTSYAAAAGAPVLLTTANDLDARTLAEIERLGAKKVTILGGKAAIGEAVENTLKSRGIAVTRLAGDDRYGTANAIAAELAKLTDGRFDTIYLASGVNYPDALSISPVAAIEGNPVLFVPANGALDKASADFISASGCKNIVILGGTAAVGANAESSLKALGMNVERIYGDDRYATSLAIAKRYGTLFTGKDMSVATGKAFPDALAGAAFAAQKKMPVVLVGSNVPSELAAYAASRQPETLFVFGGSAAVSDGVVNGLVG